MAEKVKMVRLRHIHSGALVEVPEEKVARLGGEWESADSTRRPSAATRKAAPRKRAAKKAAARQPAAPSSDDAATSAAPSDK